MSFMTTKDEFTLFVEHALEEVIRFAERYTGKTLSRKIAFRWLGQHEVIREGIIETIVNRVFVDEDHIYPCVDIGVGYLSSDGDPVIVASVAGYGPRPFQKNWTGRDGPFVFIIGQPFLSGRADVDTSGAFGYVIPDMKNRRK